MFTKAVITWVAADTIVKTVENIERDKPKPRLGHYTSMEDALKIQETGILKPKSNSWEGHVYAMLEPSTVQQAIDAGATQTEVKVTFDMSPSWVIDQPYTDRPPVPGAMMSQRPGPQNIGHLNPRIEPVIQPQPIDTFWNRIFSRLKGK